MLGVNYKPLKKLLIDKDIKPKNLVDAGILSRSTMFKIDKGEYVSLEILEKICKYLKCSLNDIVEFTENTAIE